MFPQSIPAQDRSASLTPKSAWRVRRVQALADYRLWVEFQDGTAGEVHLFRLIHSADAGVFAALSDPALFGQVELLHGAVTWPGEIDLAPDAMYTAIKTDGVWCPG